MQKFGFTSKGPKTRYVGESKFFARYCMYVVVVVCILHMKRVSPQNALSDVELDCLVERKIDDIGEIHIYMGDHSNELSYDS